MTSVGPDHPADACDADCTIRDAIAAANVSPDSSNSIAFRVKGTHELTQGPLVVSRAMAIHGADNDRTVIDANGMDRVFTVVGQFPRPVELNDMTITGGYETDGTGGGGILHVGGELRLTNVTVSGNVAPGPGPGGGIRSNEGLLALTHTTIEQNSAGGDGGGIAIDKAVLHMLSTTFAANYSSRRGGAISIDPRATDVQNNSVIMNSTISGNGADFVAAVFATGGPLRIVDTAFVGNRSMTGAALHADSSTIALKNSILAANLPANCGVAGGTIEAIEGGHNIDDGTSCAVGPNGRSLTDPQLGPLAYNDGRTWTHMPRAQSPAIDAASADCSGPGVLLDQRGWPQPQGPACDIGPVERDPSVKDPPAFSSALAQPTAKGLPRLDLSFPGPGELVVEDRSGREENSDARRTRGRLIKKVRREVKEPGSLRLRLELTARASQILERRSRLKASLEVAYAPDTGVRQIDRVKVRLRPGNG